MKKNEKSLNGIESKKQIMMAALRLFSQKGYAMTTIRDITDAAGTTAPSLYHHFGNKEGLYRELMAAHFSKIDSIFYSLSNDSESAKNKLKNVVDNVFLFVMDNRDFFRLMFSIYYGPPQGTPPLDFVDYHIRLHTYIMKTLLEGIRSKEFKPGNHHAMAWSIRAMLQLAMNEVVKDDSIRRIDREGLQKFLDFLLDKFGK